ncbi:glycosyltransferase family 2 protein [Oceaniglobus ichthyenteri]|uniref:glycosyltransferase family 2 protein n=1 Tax=Oceaniglobus ichthyenteri TaxID=2136177 RepID=UPI00197E9B88|nr:glycosyltransferase family 2 protein [Oceaniglobus ichthyenteri]
MRAWRKRRQLTSVQNRTAQIAGNDTLLFSTLRNERIRLPYFLEYYRALGINHFLIVDNGSDDGTGEYLAKQPDVSLWYTTRSYRKSRFGLDWMNHLLARYGHRHWTLTVDVDEFFVYPFCETRPIAALTDWLDASAVRSFGTMMLDMYPKGPLSQHSYEEGQNPIDIANWFDSGNYTISKNSALGNLWIQGGPRSRFFLPDQPKKAPALNKTPLVKWNRHYAYISSTHMLLPRGLNKVYDEDGGEKTSGVLLHAKFLNTLGQKAQEEVKRREHFANGAEYQAYHDKLRETDPDLWCNWSEKYINWRQLEILGLMSKGNWA